MGSQRRTAWPRVTHKVVVDHRIERALEYHRSGRLSEAQAIYSEILAAEPEHGDALHLLGTLAHQVGRHDIAVDLISQALAAGCEIAAVHANLARALEAQGELARAVASYQRALRLDPRFVEAQHDLGVAYLRLNDLERAEPTFRHVIAQEPRHAAAHTNLGSVLHAQRRLKEAEAVHRQALALNPDFAEAHTNLGVVLQAQGRRDEAIEAFQRAVAIKPDLVEAHRNLGVLRQAKGDLFDAMESFLRAIVLKPDFAEAHQNLGIVFLELERTEDAAASFERALALRADYAQAMAGMGLVGAARGQLGHAVTWYQRAIALQPDLVEAHSSLGNAFLNMHLFDAAVESYRRALALVPDDPTVHANLGICLLNQGRLEDGRASLRAALSHVPNGAWQIALATTVPVLPESWGAIRAARQQVEEALDEVLASDITTANPRRAFADFGFYLAYHGLDDRGLQEKRARVHARVNPSLQWTAPHCLEGARSSGGRIRIGFVSHYLQRHTIAKLTQGIIDHLSRDRFEVVVFHARSRGDSIAPASDGTTHRTVHLPGDLPVSREAIAQEKLDVLFYPEIGMDPTTYLLAFARLAPVQCVTWGHPVTSGIPAVDYFVSSSLIEPEGAAALYSERLHLLPRLPAYYYRPEALPLQADRGRLGLETDARLYVCPQSLFKFHPDFDAVLAEILRRDPRGRVVIVEGGSTYWDGPLRERFARNLGDLHDRVRGVPRLSGADFLTLLRSADVLLDPLHFGGGNSTYEALALGVPIITWPGAFMRGRVTYGCYRQLGIMDSVVDRVEDYAERAVRIATDTDLRHDLSSRILARGGELFEDSRAVSALEDFFIDSVTKGAR